MDRGGRSAQVADSDEGLAHPRSMSPIGYAADCTLCAADGCFPEYLSAFEWMLGEVMVRKRARRQKPGNLLTGGRCIGGHANNRVRFGDQSGGTVGWNAVIAGR
jgi:hypothetical protein